ncbi:recombination-associated protein RdgC [Pseudomonas nitroreducens]|uniref:Recombination-associated protein RdgC n=1 Tax=Pseudomonas nitroreducens TaxID=46680 RepID=A0A5R8ZQ71_PSENT|nr:recombination-associated protein RdgC [Pseudomonas nitroreducens]TLP68206.1 recombination-associated protein RdgC [Pseudomonas nitroreducens]
MWFRNLLIYRLTQDLQIDAAALEQALASKPARQCESQELTTYGFGAPFGKGPDAPLVHSSHGFLLISARKQERLLPGSVVRDELADKVEQIETDQMRTVFKKERDQLREEIVQTLLPRAFIRRSSTFAALDLERGLVLVDTNSSKKAEDLLSTLREALGSLPLRPISVKVAPTATLTEWMKKQDADGDFHVLDSAVLADTHEDGGKVVATRQDLTSEEMQLHLTAGKLVTQAALAWSDKLSFVIDDKLAIKRLRFEDLLQEKAEKDGGDDAAGQLDASFVLMMLTFREFLPALIEALGGEEVPTGI